MMKARLMLLRMCSIWGDCSSVSTIMVIMLKRMSTMMMMSKACFPARSKKKPCTAFWGEAFRACPGLLSKHAATLLVYRTPRRPGTTEEESHQDHDGDRGAGIIDDDADEEVEGEEGAEDDEDDKVQVHVEIDLLDRLLFHLRGTRHINRCVTSFFTYVRT
ncbi:hypothetical protein EYF80_064342 [Liparis tanakae]|uniref:Uncharacterized protein n=1 Tax=Liparis tanakae TaxID=230148 RepID=A0A4Z2E9N6_9TELE|nr:hypothetical protein EYF80_064342 [Liparis tanakae]